MSLALVLVLMAGLLVAFASAAQAQTEDTGASAAKVCAQAPAGDPWTIGDTVPCVALFANTGASPATVTAMNELHPFISVGNPGNGPVTNISCVLVTGPNSGSTVGIGGTLSPDQICRADFLVTIPNDQAFCDSGALRDLSSITLEYPQFDPPLTAFAGASATTIVDCPPPPTTTTTPPTTAPPTTTTTAPPTTTTTLPGTTPPPTTVPPAVRPPTLPATGGEETNLALLASAALAIGAALMVAVRRRARA